MFEVDFQFKRTSYAFILVSDNVLRYNAQPIGQGLNTYTFLLFGFKSFKTDISVELNIFFLR